MDVVTIERDFTAWIASKLNLEIDSGIFRGGIPEGVSEGVAVVFGSEVPSRSFYGFRPRSWNVQVLAKFESRDAAFVLNSCLNGFFPCSGFTQGSTRFLSVTPQGEGEPYSADDNGKIKWFVSFNMFVIVLTEGAQSET